MSEHTSFKVGGPARYFVKAESISDIKEAIAFANERTLPSYILGKGTNLLVSDSGYNGVIIQLGKFFSEITDLDNSKICAKGATPLARLARYTINEGLAGIHKLAGIPGSLGGAIYMNAGAYGQDVSQTCVEVESIDAAGNMHKNLQNVSPRSLSLPKGGKAIFFQKQFFLPHSSLRPQQNLARQPRISKAKCKNA